MQINIDIKKDLDQEQTARVFDELSNFLMDDLEDKQLMDGSFRFETSQGTVFLTVHDE